MAGLNTDVVDYVEASTTALAQAATEQEKQAAQKQACADIIPDVVEALATNGRIEPHEKEAAAVALADPVQALQLLAKTAAHKNTAEAASLGAPQGAEKVAGYADAASSPYVGGRRTGPTLADAKLFNGLGLDVANAG